MTYLKYVTDEQKKLKYWIFLCNRQLAHARKKEDLERFNYYDMKKRVFIHLLHNQGVEYCHRT